MSTIYIDGPGFNKEYYFLLDWYPAEFDYNGIHFYNTYQSYLYSRAKYLKNEEYINEVIKTGDVNELRKIEKKFDSDPKLYKPFAVDYIQMVEEKFKQNPTLMKALIKTGKSDIVCCYSDMLLGVGNIVGDDIFDETKWQGRNFLGILLMNIRKELNAKIWDDLYKSIKHGEVGVEMLNLLEEPFQARVIEVKPSLIWDIQNPKKYLIKLAFLSGNVDKERINTVSDEFKSKVVELEPSIIKYIDNPSDTILEKALMLDKNVFSLIKNPSPYILCVAEKLNIFEESEEVFLEVKEDIKRFFDIENPSIKLQLFVVEKDYRIIGKIRNPSEEAQSLALKKYFETYEWCSIGERVDGHDAYGGYAGFIMPDNHIINTINNPCLEAWMWASISKSTRAEKKLCDLYYAYHYDGLSNNDKSSLDISNPPLIEQWHMVKESPFSIRYLINPIEVIQLIAVTEDGMALKHIKNPSETVIYNAIKQNGRAIKYVKNPSEKLQLLAIDNTIEAFEFIENPTVKTIILTLKRDRSSDPMKYINLLDDEGLKVLISESYIYITYIENPTDELKWTALEKDGSSIRYIKNPTIEMQKKAVKNYGKNIMYIKDPSEELQLFAVKNSMFAFEYIKNPSEKVIIEALKQNGANLKYIKNPTYEMRKIAVEQNGKLIKFIKSPDEELQLIAIRNDIKAYSFIEEPTAATKQEMTRLYGENFEEFQKEDAEKIKELDDF